MKDYHLHLIVQIPCFNEEKTLPLVLDDIPHTIDGISKIDTQVIDDGSTDMTVEIARRHQVDHIIINEVNKGLGFSFNRGLLNAYQHHADILVNTDGDNQYPSRYIHDIIQPILNGEADIVIGNRQTSSISHFSFVKRRLQALGTSVVKTLVADPSIKDAVSGFRAYNRRAMQALNVTSSFSYVLDTTIQAKAKGLRIASVDITTNPPTRPSRLFKSDFQHIRKSAMDITRIYAMYRPMRVFFWIGLILLIIGLIPMVRFVYDYFLGAGGVGKIQSLIIGSTLIMSSVIMFALGIIADLLGKNRTLIERILNEQK